MDGESGTNNELLYDIKELIEEHLISHEEVVIDHYNDQTPIIPLSPTWFLEISHAEVVIEQPPTIEPLSPTWFLESQPDTNPGPYITLELPSALVEPEDFLNNFSVTADTHKKQDSGEYVQPSLVVPEDFLNTLAVTAEAHENYSNDTAQKRRAFAPVRKAMHAKGLQAFLIYPAALKINSQGRPYVFQSVKEAEDFLAHMETSEDSIPMASSTDLIKERHHSRRLDFKVLSVDDALEHTSVN
ncbi:UNVERIFIED_CONTAM: hypothetical protein FKN15_037591 [Acipenser sinensis]